MDWQWIDTIVGFIGGGIMIGFVIGYLLCIHDAKKKKAES